MRRACDGRALLVFAFEGSSNVIVTILGVSIGMAIGIGIGIGAALGSG